MHKNYTKFNILSLFAILGSVLVLTMLFVDSDTVIEFSDPGLEAAVRETIEKEEGTIYKKDIDTLQILDASDRKIENLEGIDQLLELRELDLEDNFVSSVSPLKNLTKLEKLSLRNNEITSLEDVHFQDILYLDIRDLSLRHNVKRDEHGKSTRLSDISLLRQMASLRKLELRDNHIEDLSPLSDLRRLTELDIRENKFESIEPLETLTRLKELNIRENKTESLEPIRYLSRLTYLNIHSNTELESLEPIGNLVNLETLIMRNVAIEDPSFLKDLTNLQTLNAIDTGIEKLNQEVIEELLVKGALQGEVRPERMLYTLEAPVVSKESGFYEQSFDLELETGTDTVQIYYTLDGSEPTLDSAVYQEPLSIEQQDANTATIIRAKALTTDHRMSETVTKSYFVNEEIKERFNLPIFSLVTDPDHLFDEKTGIYTAENAENRGSEWERPVHIELIESTGQMELAQNGGLRIHGGVSRGFNQKSLRLYAESEYDEKDTFNYDFFNDLQMRQQNEKVEGFSRLLLRNSGNDQAQTMFNDGLIQNLVSNLDTVDTQAFAPAIVFINGQYYGIQNIRERMDQYYLVNHYGLDPDEVAILENNNSLYRGGNKDVYHYTNMLGYIEEHGVQEEQHLKHIESKMDIDNFIDYFASEIYFGNADWPGNNIKYWRKTTDTYEEDAPYGHDGRWRWMLYDTDFGFYRSDEPWGDQEQPLNHTHNTINWIMTELDGVRGNRAWPNFLFRNLIENTQVRNQFLNRFNDLVNSYFSEEVANEEINERVAAIRNEMPYHIERWGDIESMEVWQEYIDRKYFFAKERPYYIRDYMMEAFEITEEVTFSVANETNEGYIRLNTIEINSNLPGNDLKSTWSGIYFKGIPVTLEAIAKEGYEFSHWENLDSSEQIIEITPENDLEIKAIFKEK